MPNQNLTSPGEILSPMQRRATYVRNAIFGGEDSLVSTVGLLSGVAVAGLNRAELVAAGVILIFVEALSMAVGSFLSENEAEEYVAKRAVAARTSAIGAAIMFVTYFVLGFIPLTPYLLLERSAALPVSVGVSILALFALGWASGWRFRTGPLRSALRLSILGGLAIVLGVAIGRLIQV